MKRLVILVVAIGLSTGLYLVFSGALADSPSGQTATTLPPGVAAAPAETGPAPAAPPVSWCTSGFKSPYENPPPGAVVIPAGDNSQTAIVYNYSIQPNTVYWFAPGVHTLGSSPYAQIQAAPGDTFVGAPGAILDGQGKNNYAFEMNSNYARSADTGVTIRYLTVQNFTAGEGSSVVGQGGYDNWVVEYNLIRDNPSGAGVALGSNSIVRNNCLTNNGEYGFNSFQSSNVTLSGNEISYNNSAGAYDHPRGANPHCGCSGGGKFWETVVATITGNYVHDNGGPGLWADTNNAGFDISQNFIANNYAQGIMYEISYNARIASNTLIGNDLGAGAHNDTPDFPGSAIYISESGSDARVHTRFNREFLISGNVLTDNWGGVTLYENANRACGLSSDAVCPLVDPSRYTRSSCATNLPAAKPSSNPEYFDNCRWKTENVLVSRNIFNFDPAHLGTACANAISDPGNQTGCGYNALFSTYGTLAPYHGWVVPNNISNRQNNRFANNVYHGPWNFLGFTQGNFLSWPKWTAGTSNNDGSGLSFPGQDAGTPQKP